MLGLDDTLYTGRRARHQTCYTFLQTQLIARTPLPGTAETLSCHQVVTMAASPHLVPGSGREVDQQLRVRGILYHMTQGSIERGFRDKRLVYCGEARLAPVHP